MSREPASREPPSREPPSGEPPSREPPRPRAPKPRAPKPRAPAPSCEPASREPQAPEPRARELALAASLRAGSPRTREPARRRTARVVRRRRRQQRGKGHPTMHTAHSNRAAAALHARGRFAHHTNPDACTLWQVCSNRGHTGGAQSGSLVRTTKGRACRQSSSTDAPWNARPRRARGAI